MVSKKKDKKHFLPSALPDEKMDALRYAAARVADYGVPVETVYAPPKTTILIIETNGKQETITVDTGNMSPGEQEYLSNKVSGGAQLSVIGSAPIPLIQTHIITSDHTVPLWYSDLDGDDSTLSDVLTRYRSIITRISSLCHESLHTDDINMKTTLKSIITMIDEDV